MILYSEVMNTIEQQLCQENTRVSVNKGVKRNQGVLRKPNRAQKDSFSAKKSRKMEVGMDWGMEDKEAGVGEDGAHYECLSGTKGRHNL